MLKTLRWNSNLLTFGLPLALILSMVLLANSSVFQLNPAGLSLAITLDLVLTVPVLYLLLIWKKNIPKFTAASFFIVGLGVAHLILPSDHQSFLTLVKNWAFPLVEITVLIMVALKVKRTIQTFKRQQIKTLDFFTALKSATNEILPKRLSTAFSTEIAVIYYGFFHWRKRELKENEFSHHKKSGSIEVFSVLMFVIFIEATAVHLLLDRYSHTAALILLIISIYSGFQLFGMIRSLSKRPIAIEDGKLWLRYGIFSESTIDLENIESFELSKKRILLDATTRKLSPLGEFDSHNVILHLKEPYTLVKLYGFSKKYKTIAFHVDDRERFQRVLRAAIQ